MNTGVVITPIILPAGSCSSGPMTGGDWLLLAGVIVVGVLVMGGLAWLGTWWVDRG